MPTQRTIPTVAIRSAAASGTLRRGIAVAALLALAACSPEPPATGPAAGGWYEFQGSWNAFGRRHVIPLGGNRRASLLDLTGPMLLAGPARPGVGFTAEVIALTDTADALRGRAVWTDENGDQVYSELQGQGTAMSNRITGTLIGGTGRYAGATGGYEFSWQYVVDADDDNVQGRSVDLKGRAHFGAMPEPKP